MAGMSHRADLIKKKKKKKLKTKGQGIVKNDLPALKYLNA